MGESGFNCWEVKRPAVVLFLLRECICNAPAVSVVLPAYDHTGSLGSSPRHVVYPTDSTLCNCLPFSCRE